MTDKEINKLLNENIERLKNKTFNVYFFVLDTKGNPNSSLEYIYKTAYTLKEAGYNVTMLHMDKEFIGVGEWLGSKYAELPHANIETDDVQVSPSDFLFIPEIFANVMMQTKNLPCKRVILVQNYNYITEFMPVSQTPELLNIRDAIVTSATQGNMIKRYFPELNTHIVPPSISCIFKKSDKPKRLIINIIAQDQSDVNMIVKPFYWMNPIYRWVSFNDARNMSQDVFSEALNTAAITIWMDDKTNFGYTLLEALRSGGLVLAKTPNNPSEWMLDKNGNFTENIIWFDDVNELPKILPSVIRSWTLDEVPEEIYKGQDEFSSLYSEEEQKNAILNVYVEEFFKKRIKEFEETKSFMKNNKKKENKK
jgi:hypothetical protein